MECAEISFLWELWNSSISQAREISYHIVQMLPSVFVFYVSFFSLLFPSLIIVVVCWQILKTEISRARIRLVEPLIKGPAGLEYLKKAFADRYGSPTDATSLLPLTRKWMASVHAGAEQEWEEYVDSVSATTSDTQVSIPTALRTGGSVLATSKIGPPTSTTGLNSDFMHKLLFCLELPKVGLIPFCCCAQLYQVLNSQDAREKRLTC
jgi:hypothetical protein